MRDSAGRSWLALVVGLGCLVACGDGGEAATTGSCDTQQGACVDYVGDPASLDKARLGCELGRWSSTPCSLAHRLGGCRFTAAGADGGATGGFTAWYYEGGPKESADAVRAQCDKVGATFVQ
jgi:hypothetical protein